MQFLIFFLLLITIALIKGYFSKVKKDKPISSEDKRINHLEIIMSVADSGQLPEIKKAIDKAEHLGDEKMMINGIEYTVNQARGIVIIGDEYLRNKKAIR